MGDSSADLERQIEQVNAERARLVTEQPAGWLERYAELGEQVTGLARRWQDAYGREEAAARRASR